MNRVTTLTLTTTALLCLVASVAGDPAGFLQRIGAQAVSAALAEPAVEPLSANDVSWLFKPPKEGADLANLISMRDLTVLNWKRDPVWSDHAFHQFLTIAAGPAGSVPGTMHRIDLPADVWTKDTWYISGVRMDPGAPGLSPEIAKQFGQRPQVRLIIQPVTLTEEGMLKVHDIAAHLAFDFTMENDGVPDNDLAPGCLPRPKADVDKFKAIVADLVALRNTLKNGQPSIPTTGDLRVHPGLNNPATAKSVRNEMKALLERHLSSSRLTFMAITHTTERSPSTEPSDAWIFLPMANVPPNFDPSRPAGGFVPSRGPALDGQQVAQLFSTSALQNMVIPTPYTNNDIGRITCRHAALPIAGPPIERRDGVSTAPFFDTQPPASDDMSPIADRVRESISDMIDFIANPSTSHLWNTDCVSCHTETHVGIRLRGNNLHIKDIDSAALPDQLGNVRGFGWFPRMTGDTQPTVSHRAGADTAAVLKFINERCLPGDAAATDLNQANTCRP